MSKNHFAPFCAMWEKSYELAKQHKDSCRSMIEEAKLSAVSEIKEKIEEL